MNRDLLQALGARCGDQKIATVDLDATIIESRKREALPTYEGEGGYQPMLAVWAETDVPPNPVSVSSAGSGSISKSSEDSVGEGLSRLRMPAV